MRQDMAKVIVTRARLGGGMTRKGRVDEFENTPAIESMTRKHKAAYNNKQLNEYLSPLYRYLDKQVGRPWNDVYSEIRSQIKTGHTVQEHVLIHVKERIYENTFIEGDKIYCLRWGSKIELHSGALYVDDCGILRKNKVSARKVKTNHSSKNYFIVDGVIYFKTSGIWYKADIFYYRLILIRDDEGNVIKREYHCSSGRTFSYPPTDHVITYLKGDGGYSYNYRCPYSGGVIKRDGVGRIVGTGDNYYATNKAQLSKKELQKMNLTNN